MAPASSSGAFRENAAVAVARRGAPAHLTARWLRWRRTSANLVVAAGMIMIMLAAGDAGAGEAERHGGAARGRRSDRRRPDPTGRRAHRAPCRHPGAGGRRRGAWRAAVRRAGTGRAEHVARRAARHTGSGRRPPRPLRPAGRAGRARRRRVAAGGAARTRPGSGADPAGRDGARRRDAGDRADGSNGTPRPVGRAGVHGAGSERARSQHRPLSHRPRVGWCGSHRPSATCT